jgi:hypothetical protein
MFSYGIPLESKQGSFTAYTGKYPAQIIDASDPDERGRVRVICPHIFDQGESHWAEACFPPGIFYIPPVGSFVWVEFFQGNPEYPIWVGQFYPLGTAPASGDVATKGVARIGDTVTVHGSDPQGGSLTLTGTITAVASKVIING